MEKTVTRLLSKYPSNHSYWMYKKITGQIVQHAYTTKIAQDIWFSNLFFFLTMKKNFWFYGNLHAFLRWLDDEKNGYNKLAETEIDKYIIDIEFEHYSLSCASNMATTNGYWSFTDNQAFYWFLSFLGACTYIINRFQFQLLFGTWIYYRKPVLQLLQHSFYAIRILNVLHVSNRPIT